MMPAAAERALVTGGTGYLGSHLVRRLAADGVKVVALIRPNSPRRDRRPVIKSVRWTEHDGTTEGMLALVAAARPTIIYHLATTFVAEHTPADVSALVRSNVELAAQLFEAAAVHGVSRLVNTSTAWQHYHSDGYRPSSLYAATKQAAEDLLEYYAHAFAMRAASIVLYDTYGPYDERKKLIWALRRALADGRPLSMSAGEQLIDLLYVDDAIDAFVAAGDSTATSSPGHRRYAARAEHRLTLRKLIELFGEIAGRPIAVDWGARPYRRGEIMHPWSGGDLVPGWSPCVSLESGIRRVLDADRTASSSL